MATFYPVKQEHFDQEAPEDVVVFKRSELQTAINTLDNMKANHGDGMMDKIAIGVMRK